MMTAANSNPYTLYVLAAFVLGALALHFLRKLERRRRILVAQHNALIDSELRENQAREQAARDLATQRGEAQLSRGRRAAFDAAYDRTCQQPALTLKAGDN